MTDWLYIGWAVAGLFVLVGSVAFVYWDAPRVDLDPDRWSGIVLLVGVVGYVTYLFAQPHLGRWSLFTTVGLGPLVYVLVRVSEGEEPEPTEEFTLPPGREQH